MVKIKNGNKLMKVSEGAFKSIYKPSGWEKVDADYVEPETDDGAGSQGSSDDELAARKAELVKVPVSNMTSDELKEIAAILGITTEGKKKQEVQKEVAEAIAQEV